MSSSESTSAVPSMPVYGAFRSDYLQQQGWRDSVREGGRERGNEGANKSKSGDYLISRAVTTKPFAAMTEGEREGGKRGGMEGALTKIDTPRSRSGPSLVSLPLSVPDHNSSLPPSQTPPTPTPFPFPSPSPLSPPPSTAEDQRTTPRYTQVQTKHFCTVSLISCTSHMHFTHMCISHTGAILSS